MLPKCQLLWGPLAISLVCSLLGAHGLVEPSLEAVCNNESVPLTSIIAVRKLVRESQTTQLDSCVRYKGSFDKLDDILVAVQTGKICDLALVDKVRNYQRDFIAESNGKSGENIPQSLRRLFLALCFQIDAECKLNQISKLKDQVLPLFTGEDYNLIKYWEEHGSFLFDLSGQIKDFDDILLPEDVDKIAESGDFATGPGGFAIMVKADGRMRDLLQDCKYKFKPFYAKLITPLVKLSNLGFNFQGEILANQLEELRQSKVIKRCYNIVLTCETFKDVKVYEGHEVDQESQAFKILSSEEVDQLRRENVKTVQEILVEEAERDKLEPLIYDLVVGAKTDKLWILDQKEFESLAQGYSASLTEVDRIRAKLFERAQPRRRKALVMGR